MSCQPSPRMSSNTGYGAGVASPIMPSEGYTMKARSKGSSSHPEADDQALVYTITAGTFPVPSHCLHWISEPSSHAT